MPLLSFLFCFVVFLITSEQACFVFTLPSGSCLIQKAAEKFQFSQGILMCEKQKYEEYIKKKKNRS